MKKQTTAIIGVILAIWFFFMGFEIGIYKERNSAPETTTATTLAPVTVTSAQTTQPATEAPATQPQTEAPATEAADTTKAADAETTKKAEEGGNTADPSSMSKEEIIAEMSNAMKKVKAVQDCTAVKTESVTINLTDLSVASLKSTVQSIIDKLAGAETETYTFAGGTATGVDTDGKAMDGTFTMSGILPPTDKEWTVDPAGVASATATKNGDSITYAITLVAEDTTFDNAVPPYSSTAYSYLDLTSLDIPVAKITDAKMHYSGTQVSITVDGNGNVTEIHYLMAMDGYGEAKVGFVSGNASFEGNDDEKWTFTY